MGHGCVGYETCIIIDPTLITEILSQGDARVDGRLTRCHGHVGCVGHEAGALHDTHLLAVEGHRQLGEIRQYFSHFITTLTLGCYMV